MKNVDVILNVSGKPYQTILTIYSLIKFSRKHINKLFIILEKRQAFNDDMTPLFDYLKTIDLSVVIYQAKIPTGISNLDNRWYLKYIFRFIPIFRYSLRYQYGIEKSKSDWVFLSHNDMIYFNDLIEEYLIRINESVGIGDIGQCWNCPLSNSCSGERFFETRPSLNEIRKLYQDKEHLRGYEVAMNGNYVGWPLPECRLNEHAALLNRQILVKYTFPNGSIEPLGYNSYDTGINFFAKFSRLNFKFIDFKHHSYAEHAYFNKSRNGHSSFINKNLYDIEESLAKEIVNNSIDDFLSKLINDRS